MPVESVNVDEMAFAMALFVAAARGQVAPPSEQSSGYELRRDPRPDNPLLEKLREKLVTMEEAASDDIPLACAVAVVWQHYEGADDRQSICSRLVAFYSLMVRSQGAAVEGSVTPTGNDPGTVVLDPSVIQAVATAPLSIDGQFDDAHFKELVTSSAGSRTAVPPLARHPITPSVWAPVQITSVVEELVKLLFACEATIAAREPLEHRPFRVLERLCEPFAVVGGAQGLQPLLSRALISTRSSYSWLSSARVTRSGRIEGIDSLQLSLRPHEMLQGELALMGSLVEQLRSLLGDDVTIQLLKTIWPLASINANTPSQI